MALRKAALRRDGWACRSCGLVDRSGRLLDADHVVESVDGGSNELWNLQTLCKTCHARKSKEAAQARLAAARRGE